MARQGSASRDCCAEHALPGSEKQHPLGDVHHDRAVHRGCRQGMPVVGDQLLTDSKDRPQLDVVVGGEGRRIDPKPRADRPQGLPFRDNVTGQPSDEHLPGISRVQPGRPARDRDQEKERGRGSQRHPGSRIRNTGATRRRQRAPSQPAAAWDGGAKMPSPRGLFRAPAPGHQESSAPEPVSDRS
jgi:hypothetical protein